ncbi:hypothetical protein NC652_041334 [Populus alba x Populus x berolinensis]|nr:hypothetical protein NC652_041334 [Populus alba x Populus x berolinensis]
MGHTVLVYAWHNPRQVSIYQVVGLSISVFKRYLSGIPSSNKYCFIPETLQGQFDDTNSEKLQIAARETCSEADAFNFDPTSVNWEAYMMDVHFLVS